MPKLGLGASWQQVHSQVLSAISLFLTYWYLTFYGVLVVILCPAVLMFYMIVNFSVRIMGYDVRLSPAAKLKRRIRRFRRRVLRSLLHKRQVSRKRSRRRGAMAQGGITHGAVTQPLIDVQNVSYCYPLQNARAQNVEQAPALSDVSLHVQHGEYVALLGHNGSGKSTLARHCNALLLPDQGRVLVEGMNTRDSAKQRLIRERIGMIFQNPDNQLIATVVEDDVAWGLTLTGYPLEAIRRGLRRRWRR